MDVGVLGAPALIPDIDHDRVAEAAGLALADVAALGEENLAMQAMALGAARIAADFAARGRIDGVLVIGGTMATDLGLDVMQALPFGMAKLIVSSVSFSHIIPPERIAPDLMMVLWAGGLWGLNTACRSVLRQAAGAVVGSALANRGKVRWERPVVGVSSLGSSTLKYLKILKPALEQRGYEVIVFHTVGLGGRALEAVAEEGRLVAVLDLCLIEVSNHALGSPVSAGAARLETAGRLGVPQIVAPGAIDSLDLRPWAPMTAGQAAGFYAHNRLIGGAPTTLADKLIIADAIIEKLNRAKGPTALLVPRHGVNEWDRAGAPMHDPAGLAAFVARLEAGIGKHIAYQGLDTHINDAPFSEAVLTLFDRWVAEGLIAPGKSAAA
jgi:uncharacterized protein (UPF0261 family)